MPPAAPNQSASAENTPASEKAQAATTDAGLYGRVLNAGDLAPLINFMTLCRRDPDKWAFFHAKVVEHSHANMGEVIQILEYCLMDNNPIILRLDDTKQVIALCSTAGSRPFSVIENEINQSMLSQNVHIQSNALSEGGVIQADKALNGSIPAGDMAARIALRRFARLSNVFMVLDDDPVVLRQMEHMLKNFGFVDTHEKARDFLTAYHRYAPNAAFVDIHLQGERGTNAAALLSGRVDPGGHVIIISADAVKQNVIESKYKGAKSFMGKPISMEMVMKNLMAIPTLYQKK